MTNKLYTKEIDGEIKVLPKNRIVIIKGNSQTFDPSEEMLLEEGWNVYEEPKIEELTVEDEKPTLEVLKRRKISEIKMYDRSADINKFYLNGNVLWFNKSERLNLKFRLEAELESGKTETNLWYKDTLYKIPIDLALNIILNLEVYASECYDITKLHCKNVMEIEDEETLDSYDYKSVYPEKLEYYVES